MGASCRRVGVDLIGRANWHIEPWRIKYLLHRSMFLFLLM